MIYEGLVLGKNDDVLGESLDIDDQLADIPPSIFG